jgi:two-component system, cell cycle sensor histidine kinase and response regulator CckA
VVDFDLRVRWVSTSFEALLGYTPAELIDHVFAEFVHPDDLERASQEALRLTRGGETVGFEFRIRTADGGFRSLLFSGIGVPDDGFIYAAAKDVTDLREAEALFEAAFSKASLAMLLVSVEPESFGRISAANAAAARLTGYSQDELLSSDFESLMHPDDLDDVLVELGRLLEGKIESFELEKRYLHSDGQIVWGRMHVSLIRDTAGNPIFTVGQVQDITDRKRAEEEAAAAERRFEQIFADAPIGMALQSSDGRYLQVNRALCDLVGLSRSELLARRFQELVHPDDLPGDLAARERMLRGETDLDHRERRLRHRDGSWLDTRTSVSCLRDDQGESYFIVQVEDITDRKRVERVVRRGRERLQAMIDGMPSAVFVKDLDGKFELVNTTLAESVGMSPQDMVGMRDDEVYPPEAVERFRRVEAEALESPAPITLEESFGRGPDASTYFTQVFALRDGDGTPNAIAGTGIDISDRIRADEERRRLEARAQEARRLETVGRLAGGVAHDFNNLLSVILNNAALAAEDLPEDSTARADLDEIRAAAERAAGLTHQLVLFSRQEMPEPEVLDPNEVVRGAERLLDRVLGDGVALNITLGDDVPAISVDPVQLERVLLNLAVNARDAMPRGGRLDIVTSRVEVGGEPYARLAVCDQGPGMSEEVAARAFEPFFTTKAGGEGAGLGLATSYGIVKQAGGLIEIDSRPGEGTDVVMRFPAADPAAAPPQESRDERGHGPGARVLVVDDEDSVRRLAARLLRDAGYDVVEAAGATDGLAALDADDGSVDLLLTDVVMPGTSGRELAEQLTDACPGTPVLFMSGYTDDVVLRHGVARDGHSFLPKPFSKDSLLRAVAEALGTRHAPEDGVASRAP